MRRENYADISCYSFYPAKNLGAYGDAGAIVTQDDKLADKMRMFANHGALKKHHHELEGINSRLDGIQAAILSVKLKYIHQWTALRIQHAEKYSNLLSGVDNIVTPVICQDAKHVFHLYVIRTVKRNQLLKYLKENGVSTGIHYPTPLPFLKAYNYLGHKPKDFSVAYEYKDEIVSLPMFPELIDTQIEYITSAITNYGSSLE